MQKEPIPEEQEMDFRPVEEGEECSDSEGSHKEEAKEPDKITRKDGEKTDGAGAGESHFLTYTPLLLFHEAKFLLCSFKVTLYFRN